MPWLSDVPPDETPAIDLNADLGEGLPPAAEAAILAVVTSVNVACGFHAGGPPAMARTVRMAAERGVSVGAHPSFPDREGFGRRAVHLPPEEVEAAVIYQVGALLGFCRAVGVPLVHVKPHGAMYNQAVGDRGLARAIAGAIAAVDRRLILFAPPGSELERAGLQAGLRVAREAFADRRYRPDGTLVPRGEPDALIKDAAEAARQAILLAARGRLSGAAGEPLGADTICVHGDTPEALVLARAVRRALEEAGVAVRPVARRG